MRKEQPKLPEISNTNPKIATKRLFNAKNSESTQYTIKRSNILNQTNVSLPKKDIKQSTGRFRLKPVPKKSVEKEILNETNDTTSISIKKEDAKNDSDTINTTATSIHEITDSEFINQRKNSAKDTRPSSAKLTNGKKYPIVPKNKKYILNTRKSFRKSFDQVVSQTPRTTEAPSEINLQPNEQEQENKENKSNQLMNEPQSKPVVKTRNSYFIKYNRPPKVVKTNNKANNNLVVIDQ